MLYFSTYITSVLIDIGRHQRTVKIARMRKNALKKNTRVLDRENEFFPRARERSLTDLRLMLLDQSGFFHSHICDISKSVRLL